MKKFFVFTCAALLLIGLSVPAMADVNLYGRVYFDTYVLDADKEVGNANAGFLLGTASTAANAAYNSTAPAAPQAPVAGGTSGNDDTDLIWGLNQIITRFGAQFSSGKLSANVEIRPNNGSYYRHWWANYDFGSWALRVGKWWDPLFFASQGTMNLFGGGIAKGANPTGDAAARTPMVRIAVPLPNKLGEWYFALQENTAVAAAGVPGSAEVDVNLPKIASSLRLNFAPTSWLLYAGYQTFDEVGRAASGAETEYSVDSWEVGLSGSASFGPFSVGANIWTGENLANYSGLAAGVLPISVPYPARYYATNNSIEDAEHWGFQVKAAFKFNDMVSIEASYQATENEQRDTTVAFARDNEDDYAQYDLVVPINIAKGFTIYPTIAVFDHDDRTTAGVKVDEGEEVIYGITWAFFF